MKKVIGLCLVLLISSISVFAQDGKRGAKKGGDPAQRCEKMIADLKLDEKQAADFRKVEAEFRDKKRLPSHIVWNGSHFLWDKNL